ncbi:MAG: hypothetical protein DCC73_06715 [Proteobacteria bacterium]|nr:MAG: hypothetical protein DCC73_06715 [Pseudomonadota bacterium]
MSTSATTTDNKRTRLGEIPSAEFSYICSRNQHQAHNLLLRAIKNSGLSQKQISQLTGIDEAVLSRLLSRPRNIELNTLSKILYAACGAALGLSLSFPKQQAGWVFRSNSQQQDNWENRVTADVVKHIKPIPSYLTTAGPQNIVELRNA